jgi:hypothetical protein
MHHTPIVVVTQNVLMKKLGISSEAQLQSSDLESYLQMLKEGLYERLVHLILELFKGDSDTLEASMEDYVDE